MNTPIVDFVKDYAAKGTARFHMPGHKGQPLLGCEALDITEIRGADDLFAPHGIIAESERNAASLFRTGCTLYSTEGSTLAIKAMLALAAQNAPKTAGRPRILAARNAHKSFLYGCGLLDIDVTWLCAKAATHLCSCPITPSEVAQALECAEQPYCAVFLTSPDYLGQLQDVAGIAAVCKRYGVPLLVDNAHGAYLAFTDPVCHPIALGATMCADSAHKTLPVLTGGAYLHVSKDAPEAFLQNARSAMALFASTSPSYLVLQSLDLCNAYLHQSYSDELAACAARVEAARQRLAAAGFSLVGNEPLKLTLCGTALGYTGAALAEALRRVNAEVEFADKELAVLMCTPQTRAEELEKAVDTLCALPRRAPLEQAVLALPTCEKACSLRDALLAPQESVSAEAAVGRICAAPTVSCPPAVPIVISGERISREAVALFLAYGIDTVAVLK